jgi:hypothetical protein
LGGAAAVAETPYPDNSELRIEKPKNLEKYQQKLGRLLMYTYLN